MVLFCFCFQPAITISAVSLRYHMICILHDTTLCVQLAVWPRIQYDQYSIHFMRKVSTILIFPCNIKTPKNCRKMMIYFFTLKGAKKCQNILHFFEHGVKPQLFSAFLVNQNEWLLLIEYVYSQKNVRLKRGFLLPSLEIAVLWTNRSFFYDFLVFWNYREKFKVVSGLKNMNLWITGKTLSVSNHIFSLGRLCLSWNWKKSARTYKSILLSVSIQNQELDKGVINQ